MGEKSGGASGIGLGDEDEAVYRRANETEMAAKPAEKQIKDYPAGWL